MIENGIKIRKTYWSKLFWLTFSIITWPLSNILFSFPSVLSVILNYHNNSAVYSNYRTKRIVIIGWGNSLQWRHDGLDSVSNHQPHHCLLSRLFGRRSKKTSKLRVTGLCEGNSLGTGEFPTEITNNAENVSIWWRHHDLFDSWLLTTTWTSVALLFIWPRRDHPR